MSLGRFPFGPLPKYPHMKPEDVAVWNRFVSGNAGLFERCDYDVCCGPGEQYDEAMQENMRAMGTHNTRRKIDVVAYKGDVHTVIEVKPIANMRGLGQILTYRDEYREDHPEVLDVQAAIVAGRVERGLSALYAKHRVEIHIA